LERFGASPRAAAEAFILPTSGACRTTDAADGIPSVILRAVGACGVSASFSRPAFFERERALRAHPAAADTDARAYCRP
jgi:hypothetical protein